MEFPETVVFCGTLRYTFRKQKVWKGVALIQRYIERFFRSLTRDITHFHRFPTCRATQWKKSILHRMNIWSGNSTCICAVNMK